MADEMDKNVLAMGNDDIYITVSVHFSQMTSLKWKSDEEKWVER